MIYYCFLSGLPPRPMPPPCSGAGPGESRTVPQCNGQCRSGQRSHRRGGPTPTSSRGRFLMQGRDLSRPGTRHSGGSRNPGSCATLRSVWIAAYAAMTGAGGRCAVPAGDARLRRDCLSSTHPLPGRLMVGHVTLNHAVEVRALARQPLISVRHPRASGNPRPPAAAGGP